MNVNELLPRQLQAERLRAGRSQSAAAKLLECTPQAISNWERGYTRIDCISLFRLLSWYGTDVYEFLRSCGLASDGSGETDEERLLRLYRSMEERDRDRFFAMASLFAPEETKPEETEPDAAVIPLYRFLAAAGYPSPQPGEDFTELTVDASLGADFAARIDGDSMEPLLHSGDVILCRRTVALSDGDVGIFYAGDGMVCKQFLRDSEGGIHLLSLNRARSDADLHFPASSSMTVMCYGKVLLDKPLRLPAI